MARFQSGPSGAVIALIIFVVASVVSSALAIMFYSDLEKAKKDLASSNNKVEPFINSADMNNEQFITLKEQAQQENRTLVQLLDSQKRKLAARLTGSESDSLSEVNSKLQTAGIEDGQNALSAVKAVKTDLSNAQSNIQSLNTQIATRDETIKQLSDQVQKQQADSQQQIDQLQAKIEELKAMSAAFAQQVQQSQDTTEANVIKMTEESAQKLRDIDAEKKKLESEIVRLSLRIKQLSALLGIDRPKAADMTAEADGIIIAVNNDDNLVYINLGRRDHLVLGMTFEVFDVERGVEVSEEDGEATLQRGKASIEVMDIQENSAVCRVVRGSATRPVLVNDVIANLVYAKDRVFKFHIYGEFDLDSDGQIGVNDYDQIVNIVRNWGGKVTDRLALDTDFLVIGREPELPTSAASADDDPEIIVQREKQKEAYERYAKLVAEAQELGIPILTQNRFLSLVGYYENLR